jgi:hypothetical protein
VKKEPSPSLLDAWSEDSNEPVLFQGSEGIPPWKGNPDWMKRWVREFLAGWEAFLASHNQEVEEIGPPRPPDSLDIYWATLRARRGDLEPMKRLFPPELHKYIRDVPRKRGEHLRKSDPRLVKALFAVVMIRDLWIETYGKWKRGRIIPTAEEIAAEFYGIHKASVEAAVKDGKLPYDYDEDEE